MGAMEPTRTDLMEGITEEERDISSKILSLKLFVLIICLVGGITTLAILDTILATTTRDPILTTGTKATVHRRVMGTIAAGMSQSTSWSMSISPMQPQSSPPTHLRRIARAAT